MFQESFKSVSKCFEGVLEFPEDISKKLKGYFKEVSKIFQGVCKGVSRMFQESFTGVFGKFQWCFKED